MKKESSNINDTLEMSYIDNKATSKNIIFFIHGNSLSKESFENQINDSSFSNYKLVSLDLPGCGDLSSNNSLEKYFGINYLVNYVVSIVQTFDYEKCILTGHSLGGHIAIEASTQIKNLKGILVFGTPPVGKPLQMEAAFFPKEELSLVYLPTLNEDQAKAFSKVCFAPNFSKPHELVESILKTNNNFRPAILNSIVNGEYSDELEILKNTSLPILIVHGKEEQLVNGNYFTSINIPTLFQKKVFFIHSAGHSPQIESPQEFNQIVLLFAQDVM